MDDKLLSVKEYARHAGITEQAVYKKLRNEKSDLHQYLVVQNHKKYIKKEALKLIEDKPTTEKLESENLREMVDLLKSQIAEKDAQIYHLQKINDQLATSNSQLSKALEDTTASLHAAQALHAQTLQQLQEGHDEQQDIEDIQSAATADPHDHDVEPSFSSNVTTEINQNDNVDAPASDESEASSNNPPEKQQKRGFWTRFLEFLNG